MKAANLATANTQALSRYINSTFFKLTFFLLSLLGDIKLLGSQIFADFEDWCSRLI